MNAELKTVRQTNMSGKTLAGRTSTSQAQYKLET